MFANMTRSSIALAATLALGLALSACAHKRSRQPRRRRWLWRDRTGQRAGVQPDRRRPCFLRHRSDRSLADRPGDAGQAGGMAQSIQQVQFHHRGSCRRARARAEYNFALGSRRAQAVRDYLVAKGVSASRMRTISYGKERPVAVCDDISCWSQNLVRAVTERPAVRIARLSHGAPNRARDLKSTDARAYGWVEQRQSGYFPWRRRST